MLVLTRKRMEQIRIGSDVLITVVKLDRNQVRLGIEAPANVSVLREELIRSESAPASRARSTRPASSPRASRGYRSPDSGRD